MALRPCRGRAPKPRWSLRNPGSPGLKRDGCLWLWFGRPCRGRAPKPRVESSEPWVPWVTTGPLSAITGQSHTLMPTFATSSPRAPRVPQAPPWASAHAPYRDEERRTTPLSISFQPTATQGSADSTLGFGARPLQGRKPKNDTDNRNVVTQGTQGSADSTLGFGARPLQGRPNQSPAAVPDRDEITLPVQPGWSHSRQNRLDHLAVNIG